MLLFLCKFHEKGRTVLLSTNYNLKFWDAAENCFIKNPIIFCSTQVTNPVPHAKYAYNYLINEAVIRAI